MGELNKVGLSDLDLAGDLYLDFRGPDATIGKSQAGASTVHREFVGTEDLYIYMALPGIVIDPAADTGYQVSDGLPVDDTHGGENG